MMKSKSILVTGGCGFVGTNLSIYLKRELKNFSIYSVDNLEKTYSKFNLLYVQDYQNLTKKKLMQQMKTMNLPKTQVVPKKRRKNNLQIEMIQDNSIILFKEKRNLLKNLIVDLHLRMV